MILTELIYQMLLVFVSICYQITWFTTSGADLGFLTGLGAKRLEGAPTLYIF